MIIAFKGRNFLMIVKKILNNNLVLALDQNEREHIIIGKGIGFTNTVGKELRSTNIEKIFVLKSKENTRLYLEMLKNNSSKNIQIITDVIEEINKKMDGKLDEKIYITLSDHLIFAIERYKNNIILQNKMLWEIKNFYPAEYKIAKEALLKLNEYLNIDLPDEEAGNIAFHIVNAQTEKLNMENTISSIKILKDIFNIIQIFYKKQINSESVNYLRFVTHFQFFIQRILDGKMLDSKDTFLYEQVVLGYPEAFKCSMRIKDYIQKTLNTEITKEEILYITVHIVRIFS